MNRLAAGALVTFALSISIFGAIGRQGTTPNSGRGVFEGSVVDSVTGQPIEGVQVAIVNGQALPETGVKSIFSERRPTLESPQVSKVIPALVAGGQTLVAERTALSVLTDARGRFIFSNVAAATYTLALRADGYNFQVYGQKPDSLAGLPIEIRDTKVDIGVIRMNAEPRISGTITNIDGVPVAAIPVYLISAQPYFDIDGERQYSVAGETSTDSAGQYVLEKISAGRYYIAAGSFGSRELISFPAGAPPDGQRSGVRRPAVQAHPFTFYPGVPEAGLAGLVEVAAGAKVVLPGMVLPKENLRSIRGRVVDYATGKPPEAVTVNLNTRFPFLRAGRGFSEFMSTASYDRSTGVFEFPNLISGQYRVDALLPRPETATRQNIPASAFGPTPQSAFQIVELNDRDVNDLVLTVPKLGAVRGKVIVTDGKPLPVAQTNLPIPLQLLLRPLNPLQPSPVVTAVSTEDGTFEVSTGLEGKYRFTLGPLRDNYYVSEARLSGAPVNDGIVAIPGNTSSELLLTLNVGGQIQGSVIDKNGQVVKQAQGVVVPDPLPEIIPFNMTFQANSTGRFTVDGIPPGNYRVYIWENVEPRQFFDRDLLTRARGRAVPVHVEKGSSVSVSVQTITQ